MEPTPDQQGVMRFPSCGKSGLFTPVEAMVIQCLESHFLAGKAMGPSVEPAATRTRSPHSAALMSACTCGVVEWGPRTRPGDGVPSNAVYMHSNGILAGPSVLGPIQLPEGVQ